MSEVNIMFAGPSDQAPPMPAPVPPAPAPIPAATNAAPAHPAAAGPAPAPAGSSSIQGVIVTDSKGRKLTLKELSLVDELDLIAAAGPHASLDRYIQLISLVACVTAIDGVPLPGCHNSIQLRGNVTRVGRDGVNAVVAHLAAQRGEGSSNEATTDDVLAGN